MARGRVRPGGAWPGGGGARRAAGPPTPANQGRGQPNTCSTWPGVQAGAELLDKIGPAIIMTHSAGGPFGLLVAEARPNLVKATVIIEGAGSGFGGGNRWGMSTIPMTYDPPVTDPAEIKTKWVAEPGAGHRRLLPAGGAGAQAAEPEEHQGADGDRGGVVRLAGQPRRVAFLKQAGVQAEELRLGPLGIKGNGHMMMVEKNSREVLQPIIDWMEKNVTGSNTAPAPRRRAASPRR